MSDSIAVDQVLADLEHIRDEIEQAACELAKVEKKQAHMGHVLQQSKDEHELMIVTATMEAYAEDVVNGKNQKMRDAQLSAYIGTHKGIELTMRQYRRAETEVAILETEATLHRRNYTVATNRLWALRAMAELHSARLNSMAGVEYHTERGERVG
ncbi:hypothetical protein LCGC14_0520310 [marine sediment metagenome]|uniref:Uncharacterized protein n=1 Tax=marine sediment metagenome TaxID=412755 RepID=A0A0F9V6T5_9ZZZZ